MPANSQVVVVTGLSGAGRTETAHALEDAGYYVVDNLPATLFATVAEHLLPPDGTVYRLALVCDVRNRGYFTAAADAVAQLRSAGVDVQVLFLEADPDTLQRRFEAKRRAHPVGGGDVAAGVKAEAELLADLRGDADLVIDTSRLSVHDLRERVVAAFATPEPLRIEVLSFGYKHGMPRDADLLLDVRSLPNPHWEPTLKPLDGRTRAVQDYVLATDEATAVLDRLCDLLDAVVVAGEQASRRHLVVAIGCTGGKHRSVTVAERISDFLQSRFSHPVRLSHRDLPD